MAASTARAISTRDNVSGGSDIGQGHFEAVEHGGDLLAAKARFPEAPEPWIDLSTGINPTPYPFNLPPPAAYARLPAPGEIRRWRRSRPAPMACATLPASRLQAVPRL